MLLNNLSVVTLTWSSGSCHLSQVQIWIRVHLYSNSSVLLLSCVIFFATPWTAALQASLSINSRSLLKLKSIESMMLSNNLILCCPLLLPSVFPASWSFPMSQLFASGSPSIGASASASILPMNMQERFTLGLTGLISLQSKCLSSLLQHISANYKSIVPLDLRICEPKRWVSLLTFTANIEWWIRQISFIDSPVPGRGGGIGVNSSSSEIPWVLVGSPVISN